MLQETIDYFEIKIRIDISVILENGLLNRYVI